MDELITSDQKLLQVNPETSRDEQLDFINTYRNTQAANTDDINQQTHAQGSDIIPSRGGLTGVGSYLATRYQQPQTEVRVATLRAAAQQAALNQALQNYQADLQEQYNQAYRKYSRAAAKKAASGTDTSETKTSTFTTDTGGGNDSTTLNTNPNTGGDNLEVSADGSQSAVINGKNYSLSPAGTAFMSTANQSLSLGIWPNGAKLTPGSMYEWDGSTYVYAQPKNTPYASVYKIVGE